MAARAANITSTEAVRRMRVALQQFRAAAQDALVQLELESRRPVEWIEQDRIRYWPEQVRKASDAVNSARIALERCELAIRPEDKRSCYDEKKAFENAKLRLRLTESKVQAVRRWRVKVKKEVEEFQVQLARMQWFLDSDFLRAIAALERMAEALDRYTQSGEPQNPPPSAGPVADAGDPSAGDAT